MTVQPSFPRLSSDIQTSEHLQEWIIAPMRGNLNEVPGIGPANIAHFGTVYEDHKYERNFVVFRFMFDGYFAHNCNSNATMRPH